jgi:hypothetical protein
MSDVIGKGILFMFFLMVIGVMAYIFLSNSMVEIPFITQLASQMGSTPHDIGLFVAVCIFICVPIIIIPLIIIIARS